MCQTPTQLEVPRSTNGDTTTGRCIDLTEEDEASGLAGPDRKRLKVSSSDEAEGAGYVAVKAATGGGGGLKAAGVPALPALPPAPRKEVKNPENLSSFAKRLLVKRAPVEVRCPTLRNS